MLLMKFVDELQKKKRGKTRGKNTRKDTKDIRVRNVELSSRFVYPLKLRKNPRKADSEISWNLSFMK